MTADQLKPWRVVTPNDDDTGWPCTIVDAENRSLLGIHDRTPIIRSRALADILVERLNAPRRPRRATLAQAIHTAVMPAVEDVDRAVEVAEAATDYVLALLAASRAVPSDQGEPPPAPTREQIARTWFGDQAARAAEQIGLATPVTWDQMSSLDQDNMLGSADAVLELFATARADTTALAEAGAQALEAAADAFDREAAEHVARARVADVRCYRCDLSYDERDQYSCEPAGGSHDYLASEIAEAAQVVVRPTYEGRRLRERAAAIREGAGQ